MSADHATPEPIEDEFVRSWDSIERWYRESEFPASTAALRLIGQMRAAGYDRKLRAGQSLYFLGLSRSRRHGLRREQPCVWFTWRQVGMEVEARLDRVKKLIVPEVELTPEVDAALRRLAAMPID